MTDLEDISHYLRIQVNYVVGKKITLYQSIYLKKKNNCFKMTECKPAFVPMNLGVANSLFSYDRNANKAIIK